MGMGERAPADGRGAGPDPGRNWRAARAYLAAGWPVVPVGPDKVPLVRWLRFQDRRPTRAEWAGWLARWPHAGPALVCGPVGGLCGLDADGAAAVAGLAGRLRHAPRVRTPRGFRWVLRRDRRVRNRTLPCPGGSVTVLGDRSLFILPPAVHPSGAEYAWDVAPDFLDDSGGAPVPGAPPELNFLFGPEPTRGKELSQCSPLQYTAADVSSYKTGGLVPPSGRNAALFRRLARLVNRGAPDRVLRQEAARMNARCVPPLGPAEVARIVRNARRYARP